MKRVFLLIAVSALLVTLGFAQTPAAGSNTDPANVKGCLGGSDGNYTVVEDGSRQIFKITTSSVDLKPHVGHDVKLTGHKASGAVSSGAADNTFAVTELSMISEHCAAAAAATVGAVVPYSQAVIEPTPAVDAAAPAATVSPSAVPPSTPAVEAAAPAATVSPSSATVSTPAADAAAPATTVSPSSAAPSTPAVEAAAPAATVSPSAATVSTPTEKAAHSARPSTHARRLSATQAAAAPATTVNPTAADAATANPSSETASAPAAAATTPTATHRAGSLSLLISFVVLVIVLGTLAPLLLRWRKRKMLERTGAPNLSFTNEVSKKEASSDQDKPEPRKVA
jgi:hypothetical protein